MRILFSVFCFCFLSTFTAISQQKHQYNFAQSYFGLSTQFIPGGGTVKYQSADAQQTEKINLPAILQNRIEIGGLHFWRKADFYISIPVVSFSFNQPDALKAVFSSGVATGARYHFTSLKPLKFSPFAGFNWSVYRYKQRVKGQPQGPELNKHRLVFEGGLSYVTKAFSIASIYAQYTPDNSFTYPTGRTSTGEVNLQPFSFGFSYKKVFDFTNNLSFPEVKKYQDELTQILHKNNRIKGITIGVGPSSAFALQKNEYNKNNRKFLANPAPVVILPDIGLGYYFYKPDVEARISYRPIYQSQNGYDLEQVALRQSVIAEVFAFTGNYHGFVPFIGGFGGAEFLSLKETDKENNMQQNFSATKASYGIVTGWDIRLNDAQPFLLRTNIRYTPNLFLKATNQKFDFSHLEVNFIQFVLYPQRIKTIRNFNKSLN